MPGAGMLSCVPPLRGLAAVVRGSVAHCVGTGALHWGKTSNRTSQVAPGP